MDRPRKEGSRSMAKCACGAVAPISGRSPWCAKCRVQRRRKKPLPPDPPRKNPWWYRSTLKYYIQRNLLHPAPDRGTKSAPGGL